ncbi:MAG: sugar ABC transporter permease [Chloroflexi bacterium]|nr:sugar ABC transporter permease [Chloroflexota bacterium]
MSSPQGVRTASVRPTQAATRALPPTSAGTRLNAWTEKHSHYWLVAPAVLVMCGILVYPLLFSLWVSLFDWRMASTSHTFIGAQNYVEALTSAFFQFVFIQSVGFTLVCLALNLTLGLALALLLNQRFHGRGVIRTLFLLPMVTAPVLAGFNFRWIFNDRSGLANQLLVQSGLSLPLAWLADANLSRAAIVIVTVWQGMPFMLLLLLAGLQALPSSPFEAATVDGATAWQRFWYITLPLLRPVIVVAVALQMIDLFRVFDTIYIMTRGGPGHATELFPFYIYRSAFSDDRLGFASALSYITVAITVVLLIPLFYVERHGGDGERAGR